LFTVARRLVIDQSRHRSPPIIDTPLATVEDMSTTDELDAALDACLVADALGTLTPAHREVLIQTFYTGRTTRETAERLDIPEGTVRSRLFYALQALRLALLERGVQQ
jgi:RNA polymerase sigma-70 factor (ECF subfamily)